MTSNPFNVDSTAKASDVLHQTDDVDEDAHSHHHTLGTSAFQAAPGNHKHSDYAATGHTHSDGDTGWIAPTLLNGWVNFGGGYNTAGYRKIGKLVEIRGLVMNGNVTLPIFALPAGYIPVDGTKIMTVLSANALARIDIDHFDGDVIPGAGVTNTWVSLDGISFFV